MIICKKCGHRNGDQDQFCASCNSFLEFTGERVVDQAPPKPPEPPPPPPPPPPAGIVERVRQAVGVPSQPTTTPTRPATTPPTPPTSGGGWVPPPGVGAQGQVREATPTPPATTGSRVPTTPTPPTPPTTPPGPPGGPATRGEEPVSRIPEAGVEPTTRRPPPVRPVEPAGTQESGIFCSRCGTPNDTRRHFCRRCGAPLAAAGPARAPWWRRLLPTRREPTAGDRPRGPSGATPGSFLRTFVATVLIVLAAGSAILYATVPGFRQEANRRADIMLTSVRRLVNPGVVEVHPSGVRGSSELTGHPAPFAADLVRNDYWGADTARDHEPTLVFTFSGPTDLDNLLFTAGASGPVGNEFAQYARPKTIELTYSDGTGDSLTLQDVATPVTYSIHARQTTFVTMRITSVYPVSGTTVVAVTEVEFFHLK